MIRPGRAVMMVSVAGTSAVVVLLLVTAWGPNAGAGGHRPAPYAAALGIRGGPLGGLDPLLPRDPLTHARTTVCPDRGQLVDHGGPVQTRPEVYVDFWGWRSDPKGEQRYLIEFLSSIGDSPWLSTLAQYCASDDPRFAGRWSDSSTSPGLHPSDGRLQEEGLLVARHFGVRRLSGRGEQNLQIIVALPPGAFLPSAHSEDCAYHERLGKRPVTAGPRPILTVLPYLPDQPFGTQCGASSVNTGARGALDGVSITEGHELAESITDPEADAWFGDGDPPTEIGDKCQANEDYDIQAGGETFAVQQLWSNVAGGCVVVGTAPGAPSDVRAAGVDAHIDVSWSAPAEVGGTPITAWTVTATPGTSSCTVSARTSCVLPGLVNGTTYSVIVRASNAAGTGEASAAVVATPSAIQNCSYVGPFADLEHCPLRSAELSDSNLFGADLAGAELAGAGLARADLHDADLSGADLTGAVLSGTDLSGADLSGSSLAGALLQSADLSDADLSGADLSSPSLRDVTSSGITGTPLALPADWSLVGGYLIGPGADLVQAELSFADLAHADLTGADLANADLMSADISHADLADADLHGADMSDADLRGADVSNADLAGLVTVIPYVFLCPGGTYSHDNGYVCGNDF